MLTRTNQQAHKAHNTSITTSKELKNWVCQSLLKDKNERPKHTSAQAYAPANIALSKYWGKRDVLFNLPVTGSVSISLGHLGTHTHLSVLDAKQHHIKLNGQDIAPDMSFFRKVHQWLDLFLPSNLRLSIDTHNSVPTAAGLASSASGFAALILAVNQLMGWQLDSTQLSVLARLGSGSACRSLWHGFVSWEEGIEAQGTDSIAVPIEHHWTSLRVGIGLVSQAQKSVGSRQGMELTQTTSHLYKQWPQQARQDLATIKHAIHTRDFNLLGQTSEHNAMSMHASMMSAWPPLVYWQPQSLSLMQQVWSLRQQGISVYLTMDAGPNVKILFEQEHQQVIQDALPELTIVTPFAADVPPIPDIAH